MELSTNQQQILNVIKENVDERVADKLNVMTGFSDREIDSMEYVRILVKLEQEFNFEFEDNKVFGTFDNILSMIKYVESRINSRNIEQKILDIFKSSLKEPIKDIDFHMNFFDAGINSVIFVEVIIKIEEYYGIAFGDEELIFGVLSNINLMAKYVNSLLEQNI